MNCWKPIFKKVLFDSFPILLLHKIFSNVLHFFLKFFHLVPYFCLLTCDILPRRNFSIQNCFNGPFWDSAIRIVDFTYHVVVQFKMNPAFTSMLKEILPIYKQFISFISGVDLSENLIFLLKNAIKFKWWRIESAFFRK